MSDDPRKIDWLEDRVLVLPDEAADQFSLPDGSRSKLIMPDVVKQKEKVFEGVIVAVGPGRTNFDTGAMIPINPKLKPGRRVIFGQYSGHDYEKFGKKYRLMRQDDVFGILPE